MSETGDHVSSGPRWERVAQSYFRAPMAAGFRVGLAGPGHPRMLQEMGQALRSGADALRAEGAAGVQVHELGLVHEERLARLAGELPAELDLLIWVEGPEARLSERSGYLLGIFAWATEARTILCLLPSHAESRERSALEQAVACVGLKQALEIQLEKPDSKAQGQRWWAGLLQGAMAREDARRRRRSGPA